MTDLRVSAKCVKCASGRNKLSNHPQNFYMLTDDAKCILYWNEDIGKILPPLQTKPKMLMVSEANCGYYIVVFGCLVLFEGANNYSETKRNNHFKQIHESRLESHY